MHDRGLSTALRITAAASVIACAAIPASQDPAPSDGAVRITQEQIARSEYTNAWQVLKAEGRRYTYFEDRSGRPLRISSQRGISSIILADADSPLIVIDGARISDLAVLADLSASAISSIEIFSAIRGTGSQGTNASAGVIYIHTREASTP